MFIGLEELDVVEQVVYLTHSLLILTRDWQVMIN